jgi:glucuronate isomerase
VKKAIVWLRTHIGSQTAHAFDDYLDALRRRHDYFVANGCKVSDHGMEQIYSEDYTDAEIRNIFDRIRAGNALTVSDNRKS